MSARLLPGIDKLHTFTVTITKGVGEAARTAKASVQIRLRDSALPIPTGTLTRDCGGRCTQKHGSQPLSVSLQLDQQAASLLDQGADKTVLLSWSLDPPGEHPLVVPALAASARFGRTSSVQLVIPAEALPAAPAVTVMVNLTIAGQAGFGVAALSVPLNAKPVVKWPLQVQQLSESRTYDAARFRVTADVTDDGGELT